MKANTLGWPTEVFDMIALISAFTTATALAPMIAYGHADLEEADLRWCQNPSMWGTPSTENVTECGAPVSKSIGVTSGLSATMSFLSVLCAVTIRGALAFEPFVASPVVSQLMQRLLTPLVVFAVGPMVLSSLLCPACFYYCGFVSFPVKVVNNPGWSLLGGWFVLAVMVLLFYVLFMWATIRRRIKQGVPGATDGVSMIDGNAGGESN